MGRPHKQGVDYFNMDVDFLSDYKIEILKGKFGHAAVGMWVDLLTQVFKNSYYVEFPQEKKELFLIQCQNLSVGFTSDHAAEIFDKMIDLGLFDKNNYEKYSVLTSKSIQNRWKQICRDSKRKNILIDLRYWIIDLPIWDINDPLIMDYSFLNAITFTDGDNSEELKYHISKEFSFNINGIIKSNFIDFDDFLERLNLINPGKTGVNPGKTGVNPGKTGVNPGISGVIPTEREREREREREKKVNRNKKENKKEKNSLKNDFDSVRKIYPGGKDGLESEYQNFIAKCKKFKIDPPEQLPKIRKYITERSRLVEQIRSRAPNEFIPDWKRFKTLVNNQGWEDDLTELKDKLAKFCGGNGKANKKYVKNPKTGNLIERR